MSRAYRIRIGGRVVEDESDQRSTEMSRAYRIRVSESLQRDVSAGDKISTCLELLDILPEDQMADLLKQELLRRGFEEKDGALTREKDGVRVTVKGGEIEIESSEQSRVDIKREREGRAWDDLGPSSDAIRRDLSRELRKELEKHADQEQARLQQKASDKLEAALSDLRREMDEVTNRVTAEAIKQKAAQMGQIKEMTEDPEAGSLTITLEV